MNSDNSIKIPFGAWHQDKEISLSFPGNWHVHNMPPVDAPEISDDSIKHALLNPVDSLPLCSLARGKRSAIIAIDDITRPTPTDRILPHIINQIVEGGIEPSNIRILIGTGAHRPMNRSEIIKKITLEIADNFKCIIHDFMGADVSKVGWVKGGPVYINKFFLQADLRVCLGSVVPHNETGFSGGAKMIVPGISGHLTINHFHGALPPRLAGQLDAKSSVQDRRVWSEQVARHLGVHFVVCAVVNSKRKLSGLFTGDLVKAHRKAAAFALKVGKTIIPNRIAQKANVVVANSYPFDSDPIQIGKTMDTVKKLKSQFVVVVNAASDGIFYHGLGKGCGFDFKRIIKNLPSWAFQKNNILTCLRSIVQTIKNPELAARLCYYSLGDTSYQKFLNNEGSYSPQLDKSIIRKPGLIVYSPNFPAWGFKQRYPKGCLLRNWEHVPEMIEKNCSEPAEVIVLPCAPLQILEFS